MITTPTSPNGNGAFAALKQQNWWVFTTLVALLFSICGAIVSSFNGRVRDLEVIAHTHAERIAVMENKVTEMKDQLRRIEGKLDRALRQEQP
jgi:hypothetical protein